MTIEPTQSSASVSLLVLDESTLPAQITEKLEREVIHARRVPASAIASERGPETALTIVWLPALFPQATATSLVRWRERRSGPGGLIGCAPEGSTADAERALEAGFDDIMVGRISLRELAGRVRALLRRLHSRPASGRGFVRIGGLALERMTHTVWLNGRRIQLTRTEYAVMIELMEAAGQARTRAEILEAMRSGSERGVSERAVDNVVMRLRRKLGQASVIETVRGVGFRLAELGAPSRMVR